MTLALLLLPILAHADLFNDRVQAQEAAARAEAAAQRAQNQAELTAWMVGKAARFGAKHGGYRITEQRDYNGEVYLIHFETADGITCETTSMSDRSKCIGPDGQGFWADDPADVVVYNYGYSPNGHMSAKTKARPKKHR